MGLCGGLVMSNAYWRASKKSFPPAVWLTLDATWPKNAWEFKAQENTLLWEEGGGYPLHRPREQTLLPRSSYAGSRAMLVPNGEEWELREAAGGGGGGGGGG